MTARNHKIEVRLTKDEKEKIEKRAKELGMNSSAYLRFVGTKLVIEIKTREITKI